jgi:hypothetical protein
MPDGCPDILLSYHDRIWIDFSYPIDDEVLHGYIRVGEKRAVRLDSNVEIPELGPVTAELAFQVSSKFVPELI